MTAEREAAIRARLAAATPGPWLTHEMSSIFVGNQADGRRHGLWEIVHATEDLNGCTEEAKTRYRSNADLIANAPADLAHLLALVDELRQSNATVLAEVHRQTKANLRQRAALDAVREAAETEIADDIQSDARRARGDVRCLDCNIRYEERQEYGCFEDGRGHDGFTNEMLADAEREDRADPREYVSLPIVPLRAALAAADDGGTQGPDAAESGSDRHTAALDGDQGDGRGTE